MKRLWPGAKYQPNRVFVREVQDAQICISLDSPMKKRAPSYDPYQCGLIAAETWRLSRLQSKYSYEESKWSH